MVASFTPGGFLRLENLLFNFTIVLGGKLSDGSDDGEVEQVGSVARSK